MQFDLNNLITILVGVASIVTFIRTSAKTQERMRAEIALLQNELKHTNESVQTLKEEVQHYNKLKDRVAEIYSTLKSVEQSVNGAHQRVDSLEEHLRNSN